MTRHLRLVPRDCGPTDPAAFRLLRAAAHRHDHPPFPVSADWPQRLEDAAAAADRCGQPVLLAPQVVRELAFLLRLAV